MTAVLDEHLFDYAGQVKGRVVVITGGSNGIGREISLLFAKHGAKVAIGDLDIKGGERTVASIKQAGGEASFQRCDVLEWEDQVDLFEATIERYGAVDIVIPNAGVGEPGQFGQVHFENGRPSKPRLETLQINLIGVVYTTHLALHYLRHKQIKDSLKALIFMASMGSFPVKSSLGLTSEEVPSAASWQAIPLAPLYSAAKHGVLGFMRSLSLTSRWNGIRVTAIHPFFADTALVPSAMKLALAGIPLTPLERVAGATFYAATNPDIETNGSVWLLPDDGPVLRLNKEYFKEGVYEMLDSRVQRATRTLEGVKHFLSIIRDLWKISGRGIIMSVLCFAIGKWLWTSGIFAEPVSTNLYDV